MWECFMLYTYDKMGLSMPDHTGAEFIYTRISYPEELKYRYIRNTVTLVVPCYTAFS